MSETATSRKTRQCKRCEGTGRVNSPVVYCGLPGTCFQCNGKGFQEFFTKEELLQRHQENLAEHLQAMEQEAKYYQKRLSEATTDKERKYEEDDLEALRERYRRQRQWSKKNEPKRGKWA
jgi:excinuclease UvrABC ATPase subunit